ncbi:Hydroxyisourate hydrolase [Hordeum vulgare]|nr:Hydroxyisourate hydrolase [Hordeum vulgare]
MLGSPSLKGTISPRRCRMSSRRTPQGRWYAKESMLNAAVNVMLDLAATPLSGVFSNMPVRPLSPSTSSIEDLAASSVPGVMAPVCTKKKFAIRKFSAKSQTGVGSKASAAGLCCRLEDDLGAASGSPSKAASASLPVPSPSGFICMPTSTARKGRRDVGVSFDAGCGSPSAVLSMIHVNEMAEAAIAKAKDKVAVNGIAATSGCADGGVPVAGMDKFDWNFIPSSGRFIIDGILRLHEIVHDLKSRNSKAVILKLDFEKAYDSLSWPFLRKFFLAKGFDGAYVHRLMQLVLGGHMAVSINGQISKFFANGRGLRQGDPTSLILFNFVAYAFSRILSRAIASGHISPVSSHLLPLGVTHLEYADDTIIMVELNDACIAHLKFILLCFEALSGLKINFAKSEWRLLIKSEDKDNLDLLIAKIRASTSILSRQVQGVSS